MRRRDVTTLTGLCCAFLALGAQCDCPRTYFAEGAAGVREECEYAVLFVGSGFSEDELPGYREIVRHYAEAVRETEPFPAFHEGLCLLRMDLTSGPADVSCLADVRQAVTQDGQAATSDPLTVPASATTGRDRTLELELGASPCIGGSSFQGGKMWLSEEADALDLCDCRPLSRAVIVVVNVDLEKGGALPVAVPGSRSIVVVGAPLDAASATLAVTERGKRLFLHELAHSFGVLDEYKFCRGESDQLPAHRNVWAPWDDDGALFTPCPIAPLASADGVPAPDVPTCPPVPWLLAHEPFAWPPYGQSYDALRMCYDDRTSVPMPGRVPWIPEDMACACAPSEPSEPSLWAGGFYRTTGVFRSDKASLMRVIEATERNADYGFGARALIRAVLCESMEPKGGVCPPEVDWELVERECE